MSSSERPISQASTAIEGAGPSDKMDSPLPHSIDEKIDDPWLVSFSPDDPDNPLVRCAPRPVFFVMFNILL
jgi:hypothetical protein